MSGGRGPAGVGLRFATKLPNASNESGLGLDTTDFYASLLVGKTVQSVRIVGNGGLGILGDPMRGDSAERRPDLRLVAGARGDAGGRAGGRGQRPRVDTRGDTAAGRPTRAAMMRFGARYTVGGWRGDGAVIIGHHRPRPRLGFARRLHYVFNAFTVP